MGTSKERFWVYLDHRSYFGITYDGTILAFRYELMPRRWGVKEPETIDGIHYPNPEGRKVKLTNDTNNPEELVHLARVNGKFFPIFQSKQLEFCFHADEMDEEKLSEQLKWLTKYLR